MTWKEAMEKKGLRVNAGKTKIMICGTGLDLLQVQPGLPSVVCHPRGMQFLGTMYICSQGLLSSA